MKCTLNIGVLFYQSTHFRLEHAISYSMCKDDFSHVDVLFIEGVIEFYTL